MKYPKKGIVWFGKWFDCVVMDRLFRKGNILKLRGKMKSVVPMGEGLALSERIFGELIGKR